MLKNILKRKISIPNKDVAQLESADMYVVSWVRRYGTYHTSVEECFQAFFTLGDAEKLKIALNDANKLLGNTSQTEVDIEKRENCL